MRSRQARFLKSRCASVGIVRHSFVLGQSAGGRRHEMRVFSQESSSALVEQSWVLGSKNESASVVLEKKKRGHQLAL